MQDLIFAKLLHFSRVLLHSVPRFFYTTGGRVVAGIASFALLCILWLTYFAPEEMRFTWVDKTAYWTALGLSIFCFCLTAVVFISGAAWLSYQIVFEWKRGFFSLYKSPSFSEMVEAISIGDDILIWELEHEDRKVVDKRFKQAVEDCLDGQRVVFIPFSQQEAVYYLDGYAETFKRSKPPFGLTDMEFPNFRNETYKEYQDYLRWFCFYYLSNIALIRMNEAAAPQKLETYMAAYTQRLLSIVFIFFTLNVCGQNANLISSDVANVVPPNHASALYVFDGGQYKRIGDGQTDIKTLLEKGQYYDKDAPCGQFRYVSVNGKPVEKSVQVTTARIEKNEPLSIKDANRDMDMNVPTLREATDQVNQWIEYDQKNGQEFMFVSFTYWKYISFWMHQNVFPFLVIALCVFGLLAWSSSSEYVVSTFGHTVVGPGFRYVHAGSAFLMYCSMASLGVVCVADLMIWLILKGWAWWALAAVALIVARIGGGFIGKSTPNTQVVSYSERAKGLGSGRPS